ncbi:hypothetical protein NIES3804_15010 [Microcystis aeruginosa NIES-3804]|uniref:Uncharacterized protein n=1 Tax=Microcystis aeruginosa NIES-3804 TaxID=2517783 RepID=A0A6H9G3Y1_MICAE|nr:hypothetical protein NIES3804_15010 [Microcystis aeruginosa NIES-3804]
MSATNKEKWHRVRSLPSTQFSLCDRYFRLTTLNVQEEFAPLTPQLVMGAAIEPHPKRC